jgi:hypothetical protein
MESYPFSLPDLASLYRELMDDPARCADEGTLESDQPFDDFERRDRLNDGPDPDEYRERMEDGSLK